MEKQVIKLNGSQLTQIIKESIKKLNENKYRYVSDMEGKTIERIDLSTRSFDIYFTDGSLYTIYGDERIEIDMIRKPRY